MEDDFLTLQEKEILKEMLSRTKKTSINYYKPFNENDSSILKKIFYKCLYNDIPNIKAFFTKNGILVNTNQQFNKIVVGDYGAFFEFEKQDFLCEIKPKFNNAPSRNVKYIWQEIEDGTKVYQQIQKVNYADYQPGKYYISATDLYFKVYDQLMPLSILNKEIEKIEKDNNLIKINFGKENATEIIICLNLRINLLETGDYLYSEDDILKMSQKYKEMNNLKIKDKNEEQQKLIKILKELRTNIYEQI